MRAVIIAHVALAACLALFCLSGCATAPSPVKTLCLPLKPYTATEQQAMADALDALPPGSPLSAAMADYAAMRAADRACLK